MATGDDDDGDIRPDGDRRLLFSLRVAITTAPVQGRGCARRVRACLRALIFLVRDAGERERTRAVVADVKMRNEIADRKMRNEIADRKNANRH